MGFYDPYDQPDPEEERRKLELMHQFAYGRPMADEPPEPEAQPLMAALQRVQPPEQLDAGAPPEPDYERAAPIIEGQAPPMSGPSPRELEDDAIRAVRDSYGQKRSFWEGAAPTAIAMGLDALFDKGRGLGPIVGGYAQGHARAARDDRDSMRQMAELEIMRAREAQGDVFRQQRNDLEQGNLTARNAELEEMRARRLAKGSPENALSQSQANLNEAKAYQEWTRDPNAIDAETQARLTQQKQLHDVDLADRKAAREDTADERKLRREEMGAFKQEGIRQRQEGADRIAASDFLEKTKEIRGIAKNMQSAEPIMADYKDKDIPGQGYVDSRLPASWTFGQDRRADAIKLNQAKEGARAAFRYLSTGAAAAMSEDQRLAIINGLQDGATEQEFRTGMATLGDLTRREIRSRSTASPDVARRALSAEGLDEWVGGWPQAPVAPAGPQTPADPIRLGGQRGSPGGGNNFGYAGSPDAGDVFPVQPGKPPMVNDYLKRLQDEDDDLGVGYR